MSDTADLYQALIMDRAKSPRHAGKPAEFQAEGEGDNPMCGDHVHVYVGEGARVNHVSRGCAIMVASAELMADAVAGLTPPQIAQRRAAFEAVVNTGAPDPSLGELNALAGVFEYRSRIRCATLPWSALAQALGKDQQHG
jgi:nitrogen fixation NifU-like protein